VYLDPTSSERHSLTDARNVGQVNARTSWRQFHDPSDVPAGPNFHIS
jgi:hypothetical protein